MNDRSLGWACAWLREKHGMTQAELGDRLGVSGQVVSYMERGRKRWTVERAVDVSSVFSISVEELLDVSRGAPPVCSRCGGSGEEPKEDR